MSSWRVGNKIFFSKLKALEESERSKQSLHYDFYDEIFAEVDWTTEPQSTWPEMLKNRALQIRQNYSYIRLWYSGGADSHTVLQTFLQHRIFIDEIVVFRASPTSQFLDPGNAEVNEVALPYLKLNENILQKTKIRILDIGAESYRTLYSDPDWPYLVNTYDFRPTTLPLIYRLFPKLSEVGTKYCDLQGGDKPRLGRDKDGRFYAFYWDNQAGYQVGQESLVDFFSCAQMPELHIKQCHLVMKKIKEHYPELLCLNDFFRNGSATRPLIDQWCRLPLWKPLSLGKSATVYSPKSQYGLKQAEAKNKALHQMYFGQLKAIQDHNPDWYNERNVEKAFVGFQTTRHYLEE